VGVGEPDWMRWAGLGACACAYDLSLMQEGHFEELDTCEGCVAFGYKIVIENRVCVRFLEESVGSVDGGRR